MSVGTTKNKSLAPAKLSVRWANEIGWNFSRGAHVPVTAESFTVLFSDLAVVFSFTTLHFGIILFISNQMAYTIYDKVRLNAPIPEKFVATKSFHCCVTTLKRVHQCPLLVHLFLAMMRRRRKSRWVSRTTTLGNKTLLVCFTPLHLARARCDTFEVRET